MFILENFLNKFIVFFIFGILFIPNFSYAVTNGMNASDLLGQYDQTSLINPVPLYTKSGINNGPYVFGFNNPVDAALDSVNHRLFVSDRSNHRVLVYNLNNDNTLIDRIPDNVLGQTSFTSSNFVLTQSGMNGPRGLVYDAVNNRLFVGDAGNRRVLVFDVTSITDGENAVNVLGQSSFTSDNGSVTNQVGFSTPDDLAYDTNNQLLFVADYNNNRVMIFDVNSITNGENAVNVLGQSLFTTSTANTTQSGMSSPRSLFYDNANSRLFVGEYSNNRIMIFDLTAITNGENAVNVLGQSLFTTNTANNTQNGLIQPVGLAYDTNNQRLFVSEYNGHRVKVFDVAAITDGENAINILGQTLFTTATSAVTQSGMNRPESLFYDSSTDSLFVLDSTNNRILIFDVASITNGENAVDLLGQYDQTSFTNPLPVYTKNGLNDGPNKLGFGSPEGMELDLVNHRLFVADSVNNRVLVYNLNNDNTLIDRIPDNVLGQVNFYANGSANTQSGLNNPKYLAYDSVNNRLFVSEYSGNRVKVFDVTSITDGENAVNVLGQSLFTTNTAALTQSGMSTPRGLAYDSANNRLFVAEEGHRVKVFDVASITNGENAINILGKSLFTASAAPENTQSGLNSPYDIAYDSTNQRLFVAEYSGSRVKVFDVASITNGENAVNILGQINFTGTSTGNNQMSTSFPRGVSYDSINQRLFVAEGGRNRVKIFDVAAITDGENAVNVLGQSLFTTNTVNNTQSGFNETSGVLYDSSNDKVYVSQDGNYRVSIFDLTTDITNVSGTSGTYNLNDVVSITVTFSSNITVTGFPKLTLETGIVDRDAVYVSGSGSRNLIFQYTVQNNDTSLDLDYVSNASLYLDGGTIKNTATLEDAILVLPVPGASSSLSYNNNIIIISDATAPIISEVTPVTTPTNDTTPSYTFTTDEGGSITYGGSCTSATTTATLGSNTITFSALTDGTYSNCTITVTDAVSNASSALSVTSFTIDSTTPTIIQYGVTPSTTTAVVTWETNENTSSIVDYGITNSYEISTVEADTSPRVTSHTVNLSSLVSCTTYYVQVRSRDSALNSISNQTFFTTTGCVGNSSILNSNLAIITDATGGTRSLSTGVGIGIDLNIPAGTVADDASFQIKQLEQTPALLATGTPSGVITTSSNLYDLKALTDVNTAVTSFNENITITLTYLDADVSGVIESSLLIYRWNGVLWSPLSNCIVDTILNTVTCTTANFSVFNLFGTPIPGASVSSAAGGAVSVELLQQLSDRLRAESALASLGDTGCGFGNIFSSTTGKKCSNNINTNIKVPSSSSCPVLPSVPKLLKLNMNNSSVKILQQILNCKGYIISTSGAGSPGKETTLFGAKTKEAVLKLQKANNLIVDGIVGNGVRNFLNK